MRHGAISSSTAARSRSGCAAAVIAAWFWPLNVIGWVCSGEVTRLGAVLDVWWIRTREVSLAKRAFQTPTPPHREHLPSALACPSSFVIRSLSDVAVEGKLWHRCRCGRLEIVDAEVSLKSDAWKHWKQRYAVQRRWCLMHFRGTDLNSVIKKHKQVKLVLFKTQVSFYWASHDSSINPFTARPRYCSLAKCNKECIIILFMYIYTLDSIYSICLYHYILASTCTSVLTRVFSLPSHENVYINDCM